MTLSFFKDARVDLNVTFDKKIRSINQSMAIKKDKSRFNIEAFGGLSTMLLQTNTLEMRSDEVLSQNIGSSRNISKVNIASNVGLGFSYELTKKLQLEINPLFKYYFKSKRYFRTIAKNGCCNSWNSTWNCYYVLS